jgi:hypothetical protein
MAKSAMQPFEFDSRMVEWNLKHSLITKDQLKAYLGTLPDESENTQILEIEEDEGPSVVSTGENGVHSGDQV